MPLLTLSASWNPIARPLQRRLLTVPWPRSAAGLLAPDLGITTFPLSGWPQGPPRCPTTGSHQRQQGTHRQPTFLCSASRGTSETPPRIGSVPHPPASSYSSTALNRGIGRESQSHIFLQWHFTPAPSTSLCQDHISLTPGASTVAQVLPPRGWLFFLPS